MRLSKRSAPWARPACASPKGRATAAIRWTWPTPPAISEPFPDSKTLFTDLNLDDVTRVHPRRQFSRLGKLYLPNTALGADLLVSMPKMKTHHWVGATLSMKNLFGAGARRSLRLAQERAALGRHRRVASPTCTPHFPRQFAIVDGIVGMEGNGPIQGMPKPAGVLVAGSDPVAVDATCCRLMRIDPFQIGYLRLASGSQSAHVSESNIRQIGEADRGCGDAVRTIPGFPNLRLEES